MEWSDTELAILRHGGTLTEKLSSPLAFMKKTCITSKHKPVLGGFGDPNMVEKNVKDNGQRSRHIVKGDFTHLRQRLLKQIIPTKHDN
jgi:hypothetical protein